jgi:hypothetical protein
MANYFDIFLAGFKYILYIAAGKSGIQGFLQMPAILTDGII